MFVSWRMEGNVWYIQALEYASAIENLKILIYAITGRNLKTIMLSERNQTQKGHILYNSI